MTQEQRRLYLIRRMMDERLTYGAKPLPTGEQEQKDLLRSLFNVRPPRAVDDDFLAVQDAYLQTEREREFIADAKDLSGSALDARISLWQGDITAIRADGIVNAANSALLGCFQPLHNCIDNSIHTKSGVQLRLACAELMERQGHEEPTGRAQITPGFNLPCRYVLHTVGPIISDRETPEDDRLLASCYRSCLELAAERGLQSLVFCCISTGVFRFPKERAAGIAVRTVLDFLRQNDRMQKVIFNVHNTTDLRIYQKLLG